MGSWVRGHMLNRYIDIRDLMLNMYMSLGALY